MCEQQGVINDTQKDAVMRIQLLYVIDTIALALLITIAVYIVMNVSSGTSTIDGDLLRQILLAYILVLLSKIAYVKVPQYYKSYKSGKPE